MPDLSNTQPSFALYRLPDEQHPHLLIQQATAPQHLTTITDLDQQTGFIFAPFVPDNHHPILLIKPETVCHGWNNIVSILQQIFPDDWPLHKHLSTYPQRENGVEAENQGAAYDHYQRIFADFKQALVHHHYHKLVLSRQKWCTQPNNFSLFTLFEQACAAYPQAFVYLCFTPLTGFWLGCSPEILLAGQKNSWQTVALAGTQLATGKTPIIWDEKNQQEQKIVADYIAAQLTSLNVNFEQSQPQTSQAGALLHLKSHFAFQLNTDVTLGQILTKLHPTPAVCGMPKQAAYQFIQQHESHHRQYYSGFVGYLNPKQRTDIYVNLRCLTLQNQQLGLFAGGGLLSSSNCKTEWAETEAKLQTLLSLINK